ncbi:unnamed protein product, partial [Mesorhabditis belari]|uniref:Uncharacterized protein n=1 Tax=Mesorhabditis belari TaxID=2138241 RepID=A0AAF3FRS4_9BILA
MAKQFPGKVALITGSSNGIGRGIAAYFAKQGCKVTVTGRSQEALDETKKECVAGGAAEGDVLSIAGNLGEESFMDRLVDETVAKFGKIDFLINNAGVGDADRAGKIPGFFTQDMDSYDYIMKINSRCIVYLTRKAAPHLEKSKGAIVNVGSIAYSEVQGCSFTFYAMSKACVDALTRSLGLEMIRRGVRVNAIKPGAVNTTLMQKQGIDQGTAEKINDGLASRFEMIPAGFIAEPEDVARLAAFLCDHTQSRYMIGQCIRLDGGTSLVSPLMLGDFVKDDIPVGEK